MRLMAQRQWLNRRVLSSFATGVLYVFTIIFGVSDIIIEYFVSDELASLAQDRIEFDGLYAESLNQNVADMVSLHQVRWQGLSGEILEEELFAVAVSNDRYQKLDHQAFSSMLLEPWDSKTPDTVRQGDDKALILAKGLAPAVERILLSEVTAEKSPSSVFTYAACRKAG